MFQRLGAVPQDIESVRVSFSEDGKERIVLVPDSGLATAMLIAARDIRTFGAECQEACRAAEAEFDRLGKDAEAIYKATADRLRAETDVAIHAAHERQRVEVERLVEAQNELRLTAFRKAELQLIAEAKEA